MSQLHACHSSKNFISDAFIITSTYPFEYVQRLIQMGAEPTLPKWRKTWDGKPYLALPSSFEYLRKIIEYDGILGCYRGFVPWVTWHYSRRMVYEKLKEQLCRRDESPDSMDACRDLFLRSMLWDLFACLAATALTYPLKLIALRCMAQFVGREAVYSSLSSSVRDVVQNNSAWTFYAGIAPCLIGESLGIILSHSLKFVAEILSKNEPQAKHTIPTLFVSIYLKSFVCYPFDVVSTNMAIVNSSLLLSRPPYMPIYPHWVSCFVYLQQNNQLRRGGSIFAREYDWTQSPTISVDKNGNNLQDLKANMRLDTV